ncbi:MAG TPA: DUF4382 domain-containing protein [Candidatus Binatia bacterium]
MKIRRVLTLALLSLEFAAPSISGGAEQAILEVRVKDHREAIGDFSKVILNLDAILVSPKPGLKFWQTEWKSLALAIPSVDLTKYVGKQTAAIFRGSIAVGSYDGVHLKIKSVEATLKKNSRSATIKNKVGPIKLAFEASARGDTVIVLDLVVLDMSDHPPAGYDLNLAGYELYTNGKLVDKIPPGS